MRCNLAKKIKSFPEACGVYLIKGKGGEIIYIGKAASLRKRLASHFTPARTSPKTQALKKAACDAEYIRTGSIEQALMLEAMLVKKHQPHYNVELKDDKSFPFIKISRQDYPRVSVGRRKQQREKEDIIYYGPYTQAKVLKEALKGVRKIFPFRTCVHFPKRPCLYYQLRLCPAPCAGKIDRIAYREDLNQLRMFLEGRHSELMVALKRRMQEHSRRREYEEASRIHKQIQNLNKIIFHTGESIAMSTLLEMKQALRLKRLPCRIDAVDVSNTYGVYACGSVVRFANGRAIKENYRRFRIKTVKGIDDYQMMREVIQRHHRGLKEAKQPLPDLVMIDGGQGHLNTVKKEFKKLKLPGKVSLIAVAKRNEDIYLQDGGRVRLARSSPALRYIQRIRDEAHRFAIGYHRKMRKTSVKKSQLDKIKGIGKARKAKLLRHFVSIPQLKEARAEEIMKAGGVGKNLALKLLKEL